MKAYNPYLPQYEHIPDGEPRVFGNRLYVYGSHERAWGTEFCTEDYVCWSAPIDDLGDWHCDGVIYRKIQDPNNRDGKRCMFAPDVVQGPDGRYYLYYALDNIGMISVAVCDSPAGRYEFLGFVSRKDETGKTVPLTDPFPFDPGVLVEGQDVYLYYGFCPAEINKEIPMLSNDRASAVCRLEPDMITVKSGPDWLVPGKFASEGSSFKGHEFFEASSIRKAEGRYYFIYSSILSHELCYAVSGRPDRDFRFGGTIISNGDIGLHGRKPEHRDAYTGNNHGSIVCVKGQWYVFYHRETLATFCCRQGCAEKITILSDGSVPQVEMTSCGLNDGPLPAAGTYNCGICCNLVSGDGAFHVDQRKHFRDQVPYVSFERGEGLIQNVTDGTNIGYKYLDFTGNEQELSLLVRGQAKGRIRVKTDGGDYYWLTGRTGELIGEAEIDLINRDHVNKEAGKANQSEWRFLTIPLKQTRGVHSLYLAYSGAGSMDILEFTIRLEKRHEDC